MQYRILSTTGIEVSEICFGCWQLGSAEGYGVTEAEALRSVEAALDLGINFFDTADVYDNGLSEQRLGQVLKGRRQQAVVATKVGSKPGGRDSSPAHIRASIERSLKRLQMEYVDLYQIHWPDPNVEFEESWGAMLDLVREGKARAVGVSNYDADMIKRCLKAGPVHSLQPPYHMFRREIEGELLELCRATKIAILPYGPQAHGLLSGKYRRGERPVLKAGDWRTGFAFFQEGYDDHIAAVEKLTNIAARHGKSIGQLAIAWTLRLPEVVAAITGPRTAAHIREHVGASGFALGAADLAEIEAILAQVGTGRNRA